MTHQILKPGRLFCDPLNYFSLTNFQRSKKIFSRKRLSARKDRRNMHEFIQTVKPFFLFFAYFFSGLGRIIIFIFNSNNLEIPDSSGSRSTEYRL